MALLLSAVGHASHHSQSDSVEREVAVMLVDFRWGQPERRLLPHDLLYALNRFSEIVGDTSRVAGGLPNQFMGDRVMVLFGLGVASREANRQALLAAAQLDLRLDALRVELRRELSCATGHVIHLHTGMAAVGETGDHLTRTVTAAGSAINVVRQLAAIDERRSTQRAAGREERRIVVSRAVWIAAQRETQLLHWHERELPGGIRIGLARLDAASAQ